MRPTQVLQMFIFEEDRPKVGVDRQISGITVVSFDETKFFFKDSAMAVDVLCEALRKVAGL
jgi:hypothetical protein